MACANNVAAFGPQERALLMDENLNLKDQETQVGFPFYLLEMKDPVILYLRSESSYERMLQGTGTNQLGRINSRGNTLKEINPLTGALSISKGPLIVEVEEPDSYDRLFGPSAHKLLDAAIIALTAKSRGSEVSIPLPFYAEALGKPQTKASIDKLRKSVKADLATIASTKLSWSEKRGKSVREFSMVPICTSAAIKGGCITICFSSEFASYLASAYIVQYPLQLLKLDERCPSAYYIGKKLFLHFGMDSNQAKGTASIISVRSLLSWCEDTIPSYDDVMAHSRHVDRLIIKPLENALDTLAGAGVIAKWAYCNAKKAPLSESQIALASYAVFIGLYISFEPQGYPSERITKIAQLEKAKPEKGL